MRLNIVQRIVILLGMTALVLSFVYPPLARVNSEGFLRGENLYSWDYLFAREKFEFVHLYRVDPFVLYAQFLLVASLTLGACILLSKPR